MVWAVVGVIGVLLGGSRLQLKLVSVVLMLGSLFCPTSALASQQRTLRVCVSDSPFPPFSHPTYEAAGQRLVRLAVEAHGMALEFIPRAWKRCLLGVHQGLYDGVIGTTATPEYRAYLAFPRAQEQVDIRRALGTTTMMLYRRVGSRANWDGQAFQNLDGPLLYLSGRSALGHMIESAGGQGLDYARTPEQLALMMFNGRGSLAIDHQIDVERISQMPAYLGNFEILPKPFAEAAIYFAVGLDVYRQQRSLFESIWWEISRFSASQAPLRASQDKGELEQPKPEAATEQDAAQVTLPLRQPGTLIPSHKQRSLALHSAY